MADLVQLLTDAQTRRTTFRLSPTAAQCLDSLCDAMGLARKDIFDMLAILLDPEPDSEDWRAAVATHEAEESGRRRTFVIKQAALDALEALAKKTNRSRDALVSAGVLYLQRRRHATRAAYVDGLARAVDIVDRAAAEARAHADDVLSILPGNDAFAREFSVAAYTMEDLVEHMRDALHEAREKLAASEDRAQAEGRAP